MSLTRVLTALLTLSLALTNIADAQQRPTPVPRPTPVRAPWRPSRPPNWRPPQSGWRPPAWAGYSRPPWARNNGQRRNSILVNPRLSVNWGWNNGRQWISDSRFWGGGFWGPIPVFSTAGPIWAQTRHVSPSVGSPGWFLFQDYGLTSARCGPQNLVYIYGPNNSVMCAVPNMYVFAGFYYVDPMRLQLLVL